MVFPASDKQRPMNLTFRSCARQTSSSSETYCCLGRAVPDGDVVFVLQRDDANEPFTVWNPRNGEHAPTHRSGMRESNAVADGFFPCRPQLPDRCTLFAIGVSVSDFFEYERLDQYWVSLALPVSRFKELMCGSVDCGATLLTCIVHRKILPSSLSICQMQSCGMRCNQLELPLPLQKGKRRKRKRKKMRMRCMWRSCLLYKVAALNTTPQI